MNNVLSSGLKVRHIVKMAIYSRSGKIYCILKENIVQI